IFGLPVLLYPILGYTVKELTAAFEQKPRRVVVVGVDRLPEQPPLVERTEGGGIRFAPSLAGQAGTPPMQVEAAPPGGAWAEPEEQLAAMRRGEADVVVEIPPDVREQIERLGRPTIRIAFLRTDEQSLTTYRAVEELLGR